MAGRGMGTVDSMGKAGLTIQAMLTQAKAGNVGQAYDHKMYLDNLMKDYAIGQQKKEITRSNQERTSAESDLKNAEARVVAVNKDLLEQKYKNDSELTQWRNESQYNTGILANFDKIINSGAKLSPYQELQLQMIHNKQGGLDMSPAVEEYMAKYIFKSGYANQFMNQGQAYQEKAGRAQRSSDHQGRLAGISERGAQGAMDKADAMAEIGAGLRQTFGDTPTPETQPGAGTVPVAPTPTQPLAGSDQAVPIPIRRDSEGPIGGPVGLPPPPALPGSTGATASPGMLGSGATPASPPQGLSPGATPMGPPKGLKPGAIPLMGGVGVIPREEWDPTVYSYNNLAQGTRVMIDGKTYTFIGPDMVNFRMFKARDTQGNVVEFDGTKTQMSFPPGLTQEEMDAALKPQGIGHFIRGDSPPQRPERDLSLRTELPTPLTGGQIKDKTPPPVGGGPNAIPTGLTGGKRFESGDFSPIKPGTDGRYDTKRINTFKKNAEDARQASVAEAHKVAIYGEQSVKAYDRADDLMLDAVGSDEILKEKITERQSNRTLFAGGVGDATSTLMVLKDQEFGSPELKQRAVDGAIANAVHSGAQSDVGQVFQDLSNIARQESKDNPEFAEMIMKTVEKLAEDYAKTGQLPGAKSSTGTKSKTPYGTGAVMNPNYATDMKGWKASPEIDTSIANHHFMRQASGYITKKFVDEQNNWRDKVHNGEMTVQDAHGVTKSLVQVARDMQLSPRDFHKIMGEIDAVSGFALNKYPKPNELSDSTQFAATMRYMKAKHGDLWNELRQHVSKLANNQILRGSQAKGKGLIQGRNNQAINSMLWSTDGETTGDIANWTPSYVASLMGTNPQSGAQGTTPTGPAPVVNPSKHKPVIIEKDGKYMSGTPVDVEYDAKGKAVRIRMSETEDWIKLGVSGHTARAEGGAMPIPRKVSGMWSYEKLPEGLKVWLKGTEYTVEGMGRGQFVDGRSGLKLYLRNAEGITGFHRNDLKGLSFPPGTSVDVMNAALQGKLVKQRTTTPQPKPTRPEVLRPSSEEPKKKLSEGGSGLASYWSYMRGGEQITEGKFFGASVLHMQPQKGQKTSGVWDGDTIYNATIEIPDSNNDGILDSRDWVEVDGVKTQLPKAWHTDNPNRKRATFKPGNDGKVYMEGAGIRLAGYDAWEISKAGGKEAKQALIDLFQSGWTDPKQKNRFIFRVRGVGTPTGHTNAPAGKQNPYIEDNASWGRIVTDVFIRVNGKEQKVAEVVFKNPANDLIDQGHGEAYRRYR